MGLVFDTVVPVFAVIALGWGLAGRRGMDLVTLADLALLVTSPALMFSVLAGTHLEPRQWGALAGGTLWIAAGTAGLALLYATRQGGVRRGLVLPAPRALRGG